MPGSDVLLCQVAKRAKKEKVNKTPIIRAFIEKGLCVSIIIFNFALTHS